MKLRKWKLGVLSLTMVAMMICTTPVNVWADEVTDEPAVPAETGEAVEGEAAINGEVMPIDAGAEGEEAVTMSGLLADNGLGIAATFPESYIPVGFHKSGCTYQGQNIEIAYMDNGNGEVVLAYLAQADGSGGDFYLCDINTAAMSDFVQISGGDGKYIIVLDPADMIVAPSGFTKAKLQWYGKTVSAWIMSTGQETEEETEEVEETTDTSSVPTKSYASALFEACAGAGKTLTVYAAEASNAEVEAALAATADTAEDGSGVVEADPSEYFLVYGINQDGVISFYLYDTVENTYQRYLEPVGTDSATEQYRSSAQKRLFVIAALAVLLVICLFIMINLYIKLRENGGAYEDDDEDEDDEMEQMRQRVVRKEQSHIRTGRKELNYLLDRDEEDEEEEQEPDEDVDDEEDEDDEEEIVTVRKKAPVKSARHSEEDDEDDVDDVDWEHMEIDIPLPIKTASEPPVRKTRPQEAPVRKKPVSESEEPRRHNVKPASASAPVKATEAPKKRPPRQNLDEDFEFEFIDL